MCPDTISSLHFNSIRLRFRNCANKPMVVQRTFQLQQTRSSIRFKALDGVIRAINEHGEKVSMSQKCGQLDRHLPEMFGVSKVILESVIFCHQEESSWPLQEGAVLKKRFDDIFEASQYTKALEAIRKLRKSRVQNSKEFQTDLKVLHYKVKAAASIQDQLSQVEDKLKEIEQEQTQLIQNSGALEAAIQVLQQNVKQQEALRTEQQDLSSNIEKNRTDIQRASSKLGDELMKETEKELIDLVENHEMKIEEQQRSYTAIKKDLAIHLEKKETLERDFTKLTQLRGNIEAKVEEQARQLKSTSTFAKELCAKYSLKYPSRMKTSTSLDSQILLDVSDTSKAVQALYTTKREQLVGIENKHRNAEDQITNSLSMIQSKLLHTHEQLEEMENQKVAIDDERRKLEEKLLQSSGSRSSTARDLHVLEHHLKVSQERLESFKKANDLRSVKNDIQSSNNRINTLYFEVDQLDEQIKILRLHERDHIALEAKELEHEGKRKELEEKLTDRTTAIRPFVSIDRVQAFDLDSIRIGIEKCDQQIIQRQEILEQIKMRLGDMERTLQESEASYKHLQQLLASQQAEKRALEQAVSPITEILNDLNGTADMENIDDILAGLEKTYFDAKEKSIRIKSTVSFLKTFRAKGEKDHACPLCQRSMSAQEEARFLQFLSEQTHEDKVTGKILRAEAKEKEAYDRWKSIEANITSWNEWKRLNDSISAKTRESNELHDSTQSLSAELDILRSELDAVLREREQLEMHRRFLGQIQELVEDLCHLSERNTSDRKRLTKAERQVVGAEVGSLAQVHTIRDAKQAEIQEINRHLQSKQNHLQNVQEMLEQLQNDFHAQRQSKLSMEQHRVDHEAAQAKQRALSDREKALCDSIAHLKSQEPKLARNVRDKEKERHAYREQANDQLRALREELAALQEDVHLLDAKADAISTQRKVDVQGELKEVIDKLTTIQTEQSSEIRVLDNLQAQMNEMSEKLSRQENWKRQIQDNLEYHRLRRELDALNTTQSRLQEKIDALPLLQAIQRELSTRESSLSTCKSQIATLDGRKQQLDEQLHDFRVELCSSEFLGIEERHRQKLIQYETTMLAVKDLETYYKALDHSLLQYHSKKIEEINSIIRTLWRITYKGQDIDTIELVSGEDTTETSVTFKAARSYNYRVVMVKGNVSIDMRGRCSAGQKVLAALVIRLALAETFCLNCGILALDEPTTNLDTENKYGLAQAITDIIHARSSQHNFQLICITHDEEFVQMLSRTQMLDGSSPEFYFRISREDM
uniref:DNA repair protein RAD50 putative n=1 Tax=Albugo laibachii Nc14 TaxID=890382 RepID=F0W8P9_9STRA|nr:DNA repair protein RAD50 putative [Albugo laibachii Nc14]|eukprot:CCA17506.1 DNA repair protein RAD50 putative [Albugo laibachii Nc14]